MKPAHLLALRILACAGFLLSGYLLLLKLTGKIDYLVGCGAGSGCDNVLGSRWSQFFYIPVTGFATLMYAATFGMTFRPSRPIFVLLAICFAGAALWFFGILLFVLKDFCPWCTAAHCIGLTSAVLLILAARKMEPTRGNAHFGIVGGVFATLILIVGQLIGPIPDTHLETGGSLTTDPKSTVHSGPQVPPPAAPQGDPAAPPDPAPAPAPDPATKGRVVSVFDDNKTYHTGLLPHLGPADAQHVIVKYFDYTCGTCKDMHDDLHAVEKKHPGKICMIMLPVPLNRACNEFFPAHLENHEHACELARLGLAAWRANPEAWPEVHEQLFTRPVLPAEIAEIAVAQIVGEEELAKALKDPWIEELITANKADFKQLIAQSLRMPKLLVGKNRMLHGLTQSTEVLIQALETEFKLEAAP